LPHVVLYALLGRQWRQQKALARGDNKKPGWKEKRLKLGGLNGHMASCNHERGDQETQIIKLVDVRGGGTVTILSGA
jgi:hypothetical protein